MLLLVLPSLVPALLTACHSVPATTRSLSPHHTVLIRTRPCTAVAPVDTVEDVLHTIDSTALDRTIRLGNHVPALASLSYFGLISMQMGMDSAPLMATLRSVLVSAVGPTTNKAFSLYFSTLVTPASFVFLIWPVIAAVQLVTVSVSALRPKAPPLTQSQLTALTAANVVATRWLITSSNSLPGALPVASVLLLPLVPLLSGHPLRASARGSVGLSPFYRPVFQIFSAFTTLASCTLTSRTARAC